VPFPLLTDEETEDQFSLIDTGHILELSMAEVEKVWEPLTTFLLYPWNRLSEDRILFSPFLSRSSNSSPFIVSYQCKERERGDRTL
jgi:hypothetical protein